MVWCPLSKGVANLPSYQQLARLLKRLHLRGLLAKIPPTRRWRVTARGQQVLGALVQLHYLGLATAL